MVPASATDITVTVENQQVKAKFVLSLQQNMTQLPNQTSTLDIASDSKLSSAFTEALRAKNPSAIPSSLTLNLASKGKWLNITTGLTLSGVTEKQGDILTVDMAWKSFNVSADLQAGNLSYNALGKKYFLPVTAFYANASRLVGQPNATINGVSFFVNKTSVNGETAKNYVGNFTVFDFRALNASLDQWPRNYTLSNNTTTWQFFPASPQLDLQIEYQQMNHTTSLFANYGYNAELTVSGLARATGNTVFLDVGTGQKEMIMVGVVIATLVLAVFTQFLYRARKRKYVKVGRW